MKRTVWTVFIILLLSGGLHAQEGSGGTRSIFSLGAGSRAISMGGAFTALGDDASALYYNPAALRLNRYAGIMVNHIQLFSGFSDASYDFIGLAYPTISAGSFGVGFMTAGAGGIREFDAFSRELGEISYRESQGLLAYAFDLPWTHFGKITAGSSVKILSQRVGEFSSTGTGLDVGFLYRVPRIEGLVLGCNLQDIVGAETKLQSVPERVDGTVMFGIGYSHVFENGSALNLAVQIDTPEREDRDIRFGAEYSIKRMLSVRLGYDSEQITAGIGFAWKGFQFDYGYFTREDAGSSHPLSLSSRLGVPVAERIRLREERRMLEEERRIQQVFSGRVAKHLESAEAYRKEGSYERALDELKIALDYDPTNGAAAETLTVIRAQIVREQEERTRDTEKSALINQHFRLGLSYYSNNEYVQARAEWRNVLAIDPANKEASDYLSKTEQKLAEQINLHRARAADLEGRGQLAAALGEWNIIRMLDPEFEEAKTASTRISRRIEDFSRDYEVTKYRLEMVELYEKALSAFGGGRYTEAIGLLDELLGKDPGHEEARQLMVRARRRITPLTDEEKEEIRRLYLAGMKLFAHDNYSGAIEEWNKILEIDPNNESVMKNLEEAERRLKKGGTPEADN